MSLVAATDDLRGWTGGNWLLVSPATFQLGHLRQIWDLWKLRHVHQNTFNSEIHGNTMEIVVSPLVKKFLSIKAIKEDKRYHHCNILVS